MKTNKPPADIQSIVNLKYLKDTFINRQKIAKELKETNYHIDKFIEEYLNQYMFSLDKLENIGNIILKKDLQKFTFLGHVFVDVISAKYRIEEILKIKFIDKYVINNFFSKNIGKTITHVILNDTLTEKHNYETKIQPSIFMDIQNKKFYFIPSNIKSKITIDYENNHLVILYEREIPIGYTSSFMKWHDVKDVPTEIFGRSKTPYMELKIDINTLKITSNGV